MKKYWLYIAIVIVVVGIFFGVNAFQNRHYTVDLNAKTLEKKLEYKLNHPKGKEGPIHTQSVKLLQVLPLDDSNIAIAHIAVDGMYGRTRLVQGPNGKYEIKGSMWQSSNYLPDIEIFNTNKGRYIKLSGENPDGKFKEITLRGILGNEFDEDVILSDYSIHFEIPTKPSYMLYKKIPKDTKLEKINPDYSFLPTCTDSDGNVMEQCSPY